jgi:erythromycin esterase
VLSASRQGIFFIWTRSQEVLPTLDYVQETVGTAHPLELAGVDNQEAGALDRDSLHLLMERFARRIGSAVPDDPEWPAAAATLHHLMETGDIATTPRSDDQARVLRLLAALRTDATAKAGADRDALFWTQALESIASFAQLQWDPQPPGQDNSVRDAQMGRNLVWLANVFYPNRKIIVWAASSHIGRDMVQLQTPAGVNLYALWNVHMGAEAYRTLGAQMYAIGFTAGTGTAAPYYLTPGPVPAARPGSLEARFQEAGLVNAFVDFRSRPAGGEWLKDVYARPFGYLDLTGDWTRVLDGMVYTRDMTPSTRATR